MVIVLKKGATKSHIEKILIKIRQQTGAGFDARKFCGVLTIKKDALAIQKQLRNEWE